MVLLLGMVQCSTSPKPARQSAATKIVRQAAKVDLIPVQQAAPGVVVDLRYATRNNLTGKPLYPPEMPCLIHRSTGGKLKRAQQALARQGFGLKVFDAYRPPEAQQALWNKAQDPNYVVPPSVTWSRHCSGTAVDVTLVDANGRELRMPTGFDHFGPEAASAYIGSDLEIRRNLTLLQQAMIDAGFSKIRSEWWHFVDPFPPGARVVPAAAAGINMPDHVPTVRY